MSRTAAASAVLTAITAAAISLSGCGGLSGPSAAGSSTTSPTSAVRSSPSSTTAPTASPSASASVTRAPRTSADLKKAVLTLQGIVRASAAIVITVCHTDRLAWKYRSPRGYLDAYVNAGHAMQNAVLCAESLGLGAWLSTAIDTQALSRLMDLGPAEFPTAVLALGRPQHRREKRA